MLEVLCPIEWCSVITIMNETDYLLLCDTQWYLVPIQLFFWYIVGPRRYCHGTQRKRLAYDFKMMCYTHWGNQPPATVLPKKKSIDFRPWRSCVCYTKHSLTSSLEDWTVYTDLKNKSTSYQRLNYSTKQSQPDRLSTWTCWRRLIGHDRGRWPTLYGQLPWARNSSTRDDLHLTTAALLDNTANFFMTLDPFPITRHRRCDNAAYWVLEFALENGGMPLDRLASIWCMGPPFCFIDALQVTFWFLPAHVTNSRNWPIHWWYIFSK